MNDVQPCQASAEVGSLADASNDERLVLSSILSGKYPEVMTDARRTLYPQDFNNSGYRWIFYICRTLHDEGCPINLSAVVLRAGQLSAQDGACGMALLAAEYSREVLGDEPTRCASEPIASGSVLEVIGDPKAFDPLTSAALDRPFFDHAMMRVRDAALRRVKDSSTRPSRSITGWVRSMRKVLDGPLARTVRFHDPARVASPSPA